MHACTRAALSYRGIVFKWSVTRGRAGDAAPAPRRPLLKLARNALRPSLTLLFFILNNESRLRLILIRFRKLCVISMMLAVCFALIMVISTRSPRSTNY